MATSVREFLTHIRDQQPIVEDWTRVIESIREIGASFEEVFSPKAFYYIIAKNDRSKILLFLGDATKPYSLTEIFSISIDSGSVYVDNKPDKIYSITQINNAFLDLMRQDDQSEKVRNISQILQTQHVTDTHATIKVRTGNIWSERKIPLQTMRQLIESISENPAPLIISNADISLYKSTNKISLFGLSFTTQKETDNWIINMESFSNLHIALR